MTRFRSGSAHDTGQVRESNEDLLLETDSLFIVADGMGGHHGGEVAAEIAVNIIRDEFSELTVDSLVRAVQHANDIVISRATDDPELRGMGTTVCALAAIRADDEDRIAVVNVGDSRAYLMLDDQLEQITDDHSLVETLVRQGQLTPQEAENHPQRNILTRALGIDSRVMVDSWELRPSMGDRYLLCSDGLFNEVEPDQIAAVLRRLANPTEAAHELVRLANESGGRDNITCIVVDVVEHDQVADVVLSDRVISRTLGSTRALADAPSARKHFRPDPEDEGDIKRKPALVTWRAVLFICILIGVLATAAGAVAYFARSTYYVGFDGDEVTIFRGRPGGLLWFEPTVEERTGIKRDDVPESVIDDLEEGKDEPTMDDATEFVENLESQIAESDPSASSDTDGTDDSDEGGTDPPDEGDSPTTTAAAIEPTAT